MRRARQVEEGRGRRWQQRRQEGAGRGSQDSGGRLARGRPCGDGIVEVWKLLGSGTCCHGRDVEVAPRGERAVLCEEAVVVVAQRLQRAHHPLLAAARRQLAAAHPAHLRSRRHGRARRRLVRRAGSLQRACTRASGCGHRGRALVSSNAHGGRAFPEGREDRDACGPHLAHLEEWHLGVGHLEGGASRGGAARTTTPAAPSWPTCSSKKRAVPVHGWTREEALLPPHACRRRAALPVGTRLTLPRRPRSGKAKSVRPTRGAGERLGEGGPVQRAGRGCPPSASKVPYST